jgi:DNA (cytosine-5)-methyltransferase 1
MIPRTQEITVAERGAASSLVAADLFCGAGGLSFGFQSAGFQIAFANDINEEYANTYRLNHAGATFFRESIEDLSTAEVFKKTGLRRSGIDIRIRS